jgi:hypothetical protein
LKIKDTIVNHLLELVGRQEEIMEEILVEPYGTTRYEILRLHLIVLELRVTVIKELFRIK